MDKPAPTLSAPSFSPIPPFALSTPARSGLLLPKGRSLHNKMSVRTSFREHFWPSHAHFPVIPCLFSPSCPAPTGHLKRCARLECFFCNHRVQDYLTDASVVQGSAPDTRLEWPLGALYPCRGFSRVGFCTRTFQQHNNDSSLILTLLLCFSKILSIIAPYAARRTYILRKCFALSRIEIWKIL